MHVPFFQNLCLLIAHNSVLMLQYKSACSLQSFKIKIVNHRNMRIVLPRTLNSLKKLPPHILKEQNERFPQFCLSLFLLPPFPY